MRNIKTKIKRKSKKKIRGGDKIPTCQNTRPDWYSRGEIQGRSLGVSAGINKYQFTRVTPNNKLFVAGKLVNNPMCGKNLPDFVPKIGGKKGFRGIKVTIGKNGKKYYFKNGKRIRNPMNGAGKGKKKGKKAKAKAKKNQTAELEALEAELEAQQRKANEISRLLGSNNLSTPAISAENLEEKLALEAELDALMQNNGVPMSAENLAELEALEALEASMPENKEAELKLLLSKFSNKNRKQWEELLEGETIENKISMLKNFSTPANSDKNLEAELEELMRENNKAQIDNNLEEELEALMQENNEGLQGGSKKNIKVTIGKNGKKYYFKNGKRIKGPMKRN